MIDIREMTTCLELIKLNIKDESPVGKIAQGQYALQMWKWNILRSIRISVNVAFYLFITYLIFY